MCLESIIYTAYYDVPVFKLLWESYMECSACDKYVCVLDVLLKYYINCIKDAVNWFVDVTDKMLNY